MISIGPWHEKVQCGCVSLEHSEKPRYQHNFIKVFTVLWHENKWMGAQAGFSWTHTYFVDSVMSFVQLTEEQYFPLIPKKTQFKN